MLNVRIDPIAASMCGNQFALRVVAWIHTALSHAAGDYQRFRLGPTEAGFELA
ncbi:unnamed protein product [marine sediment metagenome]|uniref:Uncharacterized protein n=1 Tax=marine sediment metagenome TaxID=412755 RepID=X1FI58_9ZZZZ